MLSQKRLETKQEQSRRLKTSQDTMGRFAIEKKQRFEVMQLGALAGLLVRAHKPAFKSNGVQFFGFDDVLKTFLIAKMHLRRFETS